MEKFMRPRNPQIIKTSHYSELPYWVLRIGRKDKEILEKIDKSKK